MTAWPGCRWEPEPLGLRDQGIVSGIGERVAAAQSATDHFLGVHPDQSLLQQPVQCRVQGAGAQGDLAVRDGQHLLDDRVSVSRGVRERCEQEAPGATAILL